MKKCWILVFQVAIALSSAPAAELRSFHHSYFGVYGKNASVMGRIDGSALEVWVYPYKVLHDLNTRVIVRDSPENPGGNLDGFTILPVFVGRTFSGEQWILEQKVFPAMNQPLVFLVNTVKAYTSIQLVFEFSPDLSPMWPASLGGKYSYWHPRGFFVLTESSQKNFAIFGGFPGKKIGRLPAHKMPGGKLRYQIDLEKGRHVIPLVITAGKGDFESIESLFSSAASRHNHYMSERTRYISDFFDQHLQITTPVKIFNRALKWAAWNVHAAFVSNPDLGEGLVAGYGLSGETERPGFAWYFGGDGLINSYALVNTGDFEGARREIEFLLKYQREDGKIMHELSQGAGFINWFGDYGFPYFHGDTTLYFLSFLDFYVKRTGDIDMINVFRDQILKSCSWLKSCDGDRDGIVESERAGVGASETGPLRQKMKTDILLAALSVKSWESMETILELLGDRSGRTEANRRAKQARFALDKMFWDKQNSTYAYAIRPDGSRINETTIWPAIAMRFQVLDPKRGAIIKNSIASPLLSTDWGTRFLSSRSRFYDPVSYNNGAVWPFLTGFSALALYHYGNPFHGFSLLKANLNIIMDNDIGSPAELLAGNIYRPLDSSVPNQIWSSGNTLTAFVEGLLGFDADVPRKEIFLEPAIPLCWNHLQVKNLSAGPGRVDLAYSRKRGRIRMEILTHGLPGFRLEVQPRIAALRQVMKVNSRTTVSKSIRLDCEKSNRAVIFIDIEGYVFPDIPKKLPYGKKPSEPIIEDLSLGSDSFSLVIWGKDAVKIPLLTDLKFKCEGATQETKGERTILTVFFGDQWQKKTIVGYINR